MGFFDNYKKKKALQRELETARLAEEAEKSKARVAAMRAQTQAIEQFTNSGYSHGGASRRQTWAEKYDATSYSARSDIEKNRKTLRERTRDLAMNAPIGTAAVNVTRTNVVGAGLVPKPKIDYEFLGISQEEAMALQQKIKKEFDLWASGTFCDANDQHSFYELQQIAFADWLKNGEEFALIQYEDEQEYMPYQLRIKLIEADRVCSPGSMNAEYFGYDITKKDGNVIMNGLELDQKGKVVAYWISSTFPGEHSNTKRQTWTRVAKRGSKTGNQNILHVFNAERAEQYRGVPFLAPVIHIIKQMTRYTEAEVMAAVVNSMFALFVTTETGNDMGGFGGVDEEDDMTPASRDDDDHIKLGTGTVSFLKDGESIQAVESAHPGGNYGNFIESMAMQVGAALEIAPEVLLKKFNASFSASKGAINETWKSFTMRRKWFVNDFCQQIYDMWFSEAVAKGRINAPGYFLDPMIAKAYTKATWNGTAQGYLNPVAEVNAAVTRIQNGLSTHEDECAAMNGSDFEDNIRTLKGENERLLEVNKEDTNEKD
jgi:lambda family phage portal protein